MRFEIQPPEGVIVLMERLWANGHAAYVVGGSVRDALLGRPAGDWDLATDARPERLVEVFPGAVYENKFGTVAVRQRGESGESGEQYEVTTFRTDHDYADFRRPHRVEFGDDIRLDLARRDFTVNAIAWGAEAPVGGKAPAPAEAPVGGKAPAPAPVPALVDPFGGIDDVRARRLRAVGEPAARFHEDALRMVRAVRLAAVLEFVVDPPTADAIRAEAALAGHLSGERVAAELEKLLLAARPSIGLRLLADLGLLRVLFPELAAQVGVPQNKVPGEDLFDHTLRSVDAVPADRSTVRLAALLHDIGKPATLDDGPFRGHEVVGAEIAAQMLERLRIPKAETARIVHLVRNHMFTYEATWGDAGVRRFIQRVGLAAIDELFELRRADNVGSGLEAGTGGLADLQTRVEAEIQAAVVVDRSRLAVDGDDLITELGLQRGPRLGAILDGLLERVIAEPRLNDRATLLRLAGSMTVEDT